MTPRSRDWLRGFLHLGGRGDVSVLPRDVERQEDTVLRALEMLDRGPGVVLADEVGMGKTYEALGVIAARLHARADARTLILTPGPDLNTKWLKEIRGFGDPERTMYAGFESRFTEAETLADVVRGFRGASIVVAPATIFAGGWSRFDRAYLLSLWADEAGLAGNQVAAILRRYRDGQLARVACEYEKLFDVFGWDEVRPVASAALKAHRSDRAVSLDSIWRTGGCDGFEDSDAVEAGLRDVRFRLMNSLLPDLDLLVVDEAHKLKNPYSIRSVGVRTTFEGRFEKALFLTATPFQLSVGELDQVFALFGRARSAPQGFARRAEKLLADVAEYQSSYDAFLRAWGLVDPALAAAFGAEFRADSDLKADPADPALRRVVVLARDLLRLKRDRIEPGFRAVMIRSLREDKRVYRRSVPRPIRPAGGDGAPFLLYERFIAELFRRKARTHKAAVQINMVSSYGAARDGALLADEETADLPETVEAYRRLIRRVVGFLRNESGAHPKVKQVVQDAVAAAEGGEKTLIFCTRVKTLEELRRDIRVEWERRIVARWQRVYPGTLAADIFDETEDETRVRGRHSRLQVRFQRPQDSLYLALRERLVPAVLHADAFALANLEAVVGRANVLLSGERVSSSQAERVDWRLLQRCVEQATALELDARGGAEAVEADARRRILSPEFLRLGFGLRRDAVRGEARGTVRPRWKITAEEARLAIGADGLWSGLKVELDGFPNDLRARAVERTAAYLVSKYVPFLSEIVEAARDSGLDVEAIESRSLLRLIDGFWASPRGQWWRDLLRRFLNYAVRLDAARRREVLDDVVKGAALFVRDTADGETRERLREAFNTPLFPMVLVANEVMQEGLDLHHHCRRVVHHDLAWNPAQLEQRVGRVDRIGSLIQRMRASDPDAKLDVIWPLIENTIDVRLERTVKLRERWLEFLLGAAPRVEEYGLADEPIEPLPENLAEALRVDLGPPPAARGLELQPQADRRP